jgi:hypothetical protein
MSKLISNAVPGHFAIGDYITEEAAETKLRLMKQDLYFEHVTTIVRKGSPYLTKLNKLIHSLLESGLMLKWEEQVRCSISGFHSNMNI